MEEDKHSLLQPLLPFLYTTPSSSSTSSFSSSSTTTTTTTSSSSNSLNHHNDNNTYCINNTISSNTSIILRLLSVLIISLISIWANYQASKTFDITILNDANDTLAGRRFTLSYISNDKATRIILNTSSFVEHLLYPHNNDHKKRVHSITLLLTHHTNLNATFSVTQQTFFNTNTYTYIIDLSHTLLLQNHNHNDDDIAIVGAVQRAMARVWLYDGRSSAPSGLVDGIAEYVAELAGFGRERASGDGGGGFLGCDDDGQRGWWLEKDARVVAKYLHYCEGYKKGFIQRLNEALRDTWHDRMIDDVLGMPAMKLCGLYGLYNNNNASSSNLM